MSAWNDWSEAERDGQDASELLRRPDYFAIARGEPLADFECRHGNLPGDRTLSCACFGAPR